MVEMRFEVARTYLNQWTRGVGSNDLGKHASVFARSHPVCELCPTENGARFIAINRQLLLFYPAVAWMMRKQAGVV